MEQDKIYAFPVTMELRPDEVRDLAPDVLGADGRMRVLPAAYWRATTIQERALLGHRQGIYGFPTVELVERLRSIIAGRKAIEIGAGDGVLAQALGIVGTDSFQQDTEPYKSIYERVGQPRVRYGPDVVEMHASKAVRHFKPDVVIGSWITHKYDPRRHEAGGNEAGIDQIDILLNCETLVMIGNDQVHQHSVLWAHKHTIEHPDFVFSRAHTEAPDFIAVWQRSNR